MKLYDVWKSSKKYIELFTLLYTIYSYIYTPSEKSFFKHNKESVNVIVQYVNFFSTY